MVVSNALVSGASMHRGEHIISSDQHFIFIHQYDGNVVVYDADSGKPCWSTGTSGKETVLLKMQEDSNLVLYATGGKPIWASDTYGSGAKSLVMQNDGNLVLYTDEGSPKWGADCHQGIRARSEFSVNQVMRSRDELTSANGRNVLRLEKDGSLVLLKNGRTSWSSGTGGTGANVLVLQIDGNMGLYRDTGRVWSSDTQGRNGRNAVMQDDGNFVIYTAEGKPVWATNTA